MSKISVLPSEVADQIAAGEVVERPFSVVKELLENALDAGAQSIDISIEDGGKALIRISDDGSGMASDDAVIALQRHGTSKIRTASDLTHVSTFGFRGEALPAIASVSRLELHTSTEDGSGSILRVEGGRSQDASELPRRKGTTITVSNLFYNVPARQKFLKGAKSEWRAIMESLTGVALTRCDVRISVSNDGKSVLSLPTATDFRSRLAAIWGGKYAEKLLEVNDGLGSIGVVGLIERPSDAGTTTRRVFLSVNSRPIRDFGLVRAVESAYRSTIPAGVRPSMFLNIIVPSDELDVNVHPAKAEVRFTDRWRTERAVENIIRSSLGNLDSSASMGARFSTNFFQRPVDNQLGGPNEFDYLKSQVAGNTPLFANTDTFRSGAARALDSADILSSGSGEQHTYSTSEFNGSSFSGSSSVSESYTYSDLVVPELRQLNRTYIAVQQPEGLVLIDQHSAHERILYEKFMRELEGGNVPTQRLLIPITLHLGPAEAEAFESNREIFEKLGFEISEFGGNTLMVSTVPMPHKRFDAEQCLRDTLESLSGNRHSGTASRHEKLAATVACKAAIKGGDHLSVDEMKALYVALRDTDLPAHDVHGRSTVVQISWDEIDRRFGRS